MQAAVTTLQSFNGSAAQTCAMGQLLGKGVKISMQLSYKKHD